MYRADRGLVRLEKHDFVLSFLAQCHLLNEVIRLGLRFFISLQKPHLSYFRVASIHGLRNEGADQLICLTEKSFVLRRINPILKFLVTWLLRYFLCCFLSYDGLDLWLT